MSDCFILLSAGKSKRFKSKINKQFITYKNKPLFEHSLKTALDSNLFKKILIVSNKKYKKINYKNKNTLNFKIIKTIKSDVYELYLNNETKSSLIKHSYASIPNIKTSKWLKELFDKKENIIVECKLNKRFNKWTPIKEGENVDCISLI